MKISGKTYDSLKNLAQIWLPAAGTLYAGLAVIWNLPAAEQVGGTVLAVDTFLGIVLGISSAQYQKSGDKFSGTMAFVQDTPEDAPYLKLTSIDYDALHSQDEITFRLVQSPK
jgi:hypothetical protein